MNGVFFVIWIVLNLLVGYNLLLPMLFFCIYKILPVKKYLAKYNSEPDYAIIVTAYEHINTLEQAIVSLLGLNYNNYLIYVVADKCDVSGLHFTDERVIILRPEEELRSNTRSHLYAMDRFRRDHEFVTIIDSDNLTHSEYLNELNLLFRQGFLAVQGVRKAKNLNSVYACLDAAQDIYYHFYDREILFAIGSSATLAGSGMAFKANYYHEFLKKFDVKGAGFDKVLQIEILKAGHRIAFSKNAFVWDEKTSKSDQLVKQRARWFNTWFKYAGLGFTLIAKGVIGFNRNKFLFGLMFLRPPLFLVMVSSLLLLVMNFFISTSLVYFWIAGFVLFFAAFMISLLHSKADKRIYKSLVGIPMFVFYQVLSLLKVRKANQISVSTQHFYTKPLDELAEKNS